VSNKSVAIFIGLERKAWWKFTREEKTEKIGRPNNDIAENGEKVGDGRPLVRDDDGLLDGRVGNVEGWDGANVAPATSEEGRSGVRAAILCKRQWQGRERNKIKPLAEVCRRKILSRKGERGLNGPPHFQALILAVEQ
jgi:hypothetical protein